MTADRPRQHITLPEDVLEVIRAITSNAALTPTQRFTGALVMTWGWAWYEERDIIDPTQVVLSTEQWQQVCGYLTSGVMSDRISRVNLGLDWMNRGPSAYEP